MVILKQVLESTEGMPFAFPTHLRLHPLPVGVHRAFELPVTIRAFEHDNRRVARESRVNGAQMQ